MSVPNRAPVVADSIRPVLLVRGESIVVALTAYFRDPDGDTLRYEAASSDGEVVTASLSGDTITVTAIAEGTAEVTVTAQDRGGLSASQTFLVVVSNQAPVVVDTIPALLLSRGDAVMIELITYFRDPDGDTLRYEAESSGTEVVTASLSGDTITVTAIAEGTAEVTVTAQDPGGLSASQTFRVVVSNRAPVVTDSIRSVVLIKDRSTTIEVSRHFRDPDGDTLRYSVESSDTGVATASMSDTTLTVAAVAPGVTEVTVTALDPGGLSASLRFDVTVAASADRAALIALYEATDGPNWDNSDNWLTEAPLGDWHGVYVDATGRVVRVDLPSNRLSGSMPPQIGWLTELTSLSLFVNRLTGPIPPEIGSLRELEHLDLQVNDLTGSIPPEIGNLMHLTFLNLNRNQLSGPIPPEIGNLAELEFLSINHNSLTGSLPPELGRLASLETLSFYYNYLTGGIPAELGNLSELWRLTLSVNDLTGRIPPELGRLGALVWLDLERNDLTGPIPPELGGLDSLRSMALQWNDLTGSIPHELGNISELNWLRLSHNQLTGGVPATLLQTGPSILEITGNHGLCVPGLRAFATWLRRIPTVAADFCNVADRAALIALYGATRGPDWANSDGWLGDSVLDEWYGVDTDSLGQVRTLDLTGNGLRGMLPSALGQSLEGLSELRIGNNALSGPLPRSFITLALRELHYAGTDLCVPLEGVFRIWLNSIPSHQGSEEECSPLSDRAILSALYEATGGPNWKRADNWNTDAQLGDWYGVEVDGDGRVTSLRLNYNGLTRVLPLELAWLERLEFLEIGGNELEGPIPSQLGWIEGLKSLVLTTNNLTGSIPPSLANLADLVHLNLENNELSGLIPRALGSLSALETLQLGGNNLSGSIPPELGALSNLTSLGLTVTKLSGPIPPELGALSNLDTLKLSVTNLSGPIPPELGLLEELQALRVAASRLTGPIPPELGLLSNLRHLNLDHNNLSGAIPPELGSLSNLRQLELSGNGLTGPIPPELGSLSSLRGLTLVANELTGSIPPELGLLSNLTHLQLFLNELTGPIPPELGSLSKLEFLQLRENNLTGPIPATLGLLSSLKQLHVDQNNLTGPVPQELGSLLNLTEMRLFLNVGLAGPLPLSLTNLRHLTQLLTTSTDLCAPVDAAFREWLEGVAEQRVKRCVAPTADVYLTQAVQSREFPVAMVAGDEALLRVFVTAPAPTSADLPPVRATFYLDGRETYVTDIPGQRSPIPIRVDESSLAHSASARIPGDVIQPGLEMVIEVDPGGTLDPSIGVTRRVPDDGRLAVDVRSVPSLDLTLIPFLWSERPDSAISEMIDAMASNPQDDSLLWKTRTLLPVGDLDVTAHAPVLTSSNNAHNLLSETSVIRRLEGGRGYYQGMMSGLVAGPAGVATVGGRSSFAIPTGHTIAHELGHSMGLLHAPCGVAAAVDPAFPDSDGRIGSWGYDFRGDGGLVEPSTKDLMSYCGPNWISDYHFTNALRYRLLNDRPAANGSPARSMLLWGGIGEGGNLFLEPAFVVDAAPALPDSAGDHGLDGTSSDGRSLFSLSFTMPEPADGEGGGAFVFVLPLQPGWTDALSRITLSGPGGSVSLDSKSNRPMAILMDSRRRSVRGILRDLPAPAGTRADVWAELSPGRGIDVLFSRGIPDFDSQR